MHEQLIFLVLNDLLGHSLAIAKALSTLTCSLRVAQSATWPPRRLSLHREQRRGPRRPEPQLFPSGSPFRSWGPLTRPLHVFGRSTSKTPSALLPSSRVPSVRFSLRWTAVSWALVTTSFQGASPEPLAAVLSSAARWH